MVGAVGNGRQAFLGILLACGALAGALPSAEGAPTYCASVESASPNCRGGGEACVTTNGWCDSWSGGAYTVCVAKASCNTPGLVCVSTGYSACEGVAVSAQGTTTTGCGTKATMSTPCVDEEPAVAVATGTYHSCALLASGNVRCWGYNQNRQAEGYWGGDALAVSAGYQHTCVLVAGGNVRCWGYNYSGQATGYFGGDAVALSSGFSHNCVLRTNGNVHCWGDASAAVPYTGGDAVEISAGGSYTCARLTSGNVHCWGWDAYWRPLQGYSGGDAVHVEVDSIDACVVTSSGEIKCWEAPAYGDPLPPPSGYFTDVSVGGYVMCGLTYDGNVVCWGYNNWYSHPIHYWGGDAVAISIGLDHVCALRTNGRVFCWGDNSFRQAEGYSPFPDRAKALAVDTVLDAAAPALGLADTAIGIALGAAGTAIGIVDGVASTDSDRDGYSDAMEIQEKSDPQAGGSQPGTDDDGDGRANRDEASRPHASGAVTNPRVFAAASDSVTIHFGLGGTTASVTSPTGAVMRVTYAPALRDCPGPVPRPAGELLHDCALPVVATVDFRGRVVAARGAYAADAQVAVPASDFAVTCLRGQKPGLECLDGAGADATWTLEPARNYAGLPAGMSVTVRGKTFVDSTTDMAAGGSGESSRSAGMPVRLWNWPYQGAASYAACEAPTPNLCLSGPPEENARDASVFAGE